MAVITIPVGGQAIPIEIPDFAMESTQQAILQTSQQMNAALAKMAGLEASQKNTNQQLAQQVKQQTQAQRQQETESRERRKSERDLLGSMKGFANSAMGGKTSMADMSRKLFDVVGGPAARFGTAIGAASGFMEEMGLAFRMQARTGMNFADNLTDIMDSAARAGLTLDQFSQIVGKAGPAVRALGTNTNSGAKAFTSFNQGFLDTLYQFGNFGMQADEIAGVLTQELEARRAQLGVSQMANINQQEFNAALTESIKVTQAMSKLTGEDFTAARKRSMQVQGNEGLASLIRSTGMQGLGRETGTVAAAFRGPVGERVMNAIVESMALGGGHLTMIDPLLERMLGASGMQDIRGIEQMLLSGASAEDVLSTYAGRITNLTSGTMYKPEELRRLRATGDEEGTAILQQRMVDMNFTPQMLADAIAETEAMTDDQAALMRLLVEQGKMGAAANKQTAEFFMAMVGGDLNEAAKGFELMGQAFTKAILSDEFTAFAKSAGTMFGEASILPLMRFVGALPGVTFSDQLAMMSIPLSAAGLDDIARTALLPTNVAAGMSGLKTLLTDPSITGNLDNSQQAVVDGILAAINAAQSANASAGSFNAAQFAQLMDAIRQIVPGT
jgi:hypothetical protein